MRRRAVLSAITVAALLAPAAARAADLVPTACPPAVVVFPATPPEGVPVGTVVARVGPPYRLERSRFTGQPRTVVFNDPGSLPGSVDPEFALVPLPRARHFHTQAVYPRGY